MSLKYKLACLIGVLVTIVLGVAAGTLYVIERKLFYDRLEKNRGTLVEQFSQACLAGLVVGDELAVINAARTVRRAPGVADAYCETDRRLGAGSVTPNRPEARRRELEWKGGRATAVVVFDGEVAAEDSSAALSGVVRRSAAAFVWALAAGALGAWMLAARWTVPLRRLGEASRRLAKGDMGVRLPGARRDELGDLARDFNTMAQRLGELDQMKKDFVSNVTHELRSPLSAIESYVNQLADDARAGRNETLPDYLTIIRNNTTRLGRFVTQLLDVARIEAGKTEPRWADVSLYDAIEEVIVLFSARAREKGVSLTSIPTRLVAWADPDMVQQMLTNYVGNALKFTSAGGRVEVRAVECEAVGSRPGVRVEVADTGQGLSVEEVGRLFQRFERVHDSRAADTKGTGLGLTIVRGLAEAHGGRAGVDSQVGRGSTFYVVLPQART